MEGGTTTLKEVVVKSPVKSHNPKIKIDIKIPNNANDGAKVQYYVPQLKFDVGSFNLNSKPVIQDKAFDFNDFLSKTRTNLEHEEYLAKSVGLKSVSEKVGIAGTITSGISIVNNLAHKRWWDATKDGAELVIGKTAAAPYYYGLKLIPEVFTGSTTMSKAYFELDEERNILVNNFRAYRQQGDEQQVEKITKRLIEIETIQNNILNSLKANQEN